MSQGSRLAGSIIKAANDTAPLIVDGIQVDIRSFVIIITIITITIIIFIFIMLQEFTDQIPLITGFASAYAEVNAEQTQKVRYRLSDNSVFLLTNERKLLMFLHSTLNYCQVVNTFYTSLQCDLQCKDLEDTDLKAECEVQFCKKAEDEDEV